MARNAPGVVRAATPADEMDKTVNVSVMEGLNAGVRGNKHLRRNRNRHCDSEHNNGVRLGTPAGAVGRSFGEALFMQLFGDARQISYEVRRPERGIAGLTPCVAGGRRTSSPKRGYQSSRHLGIGQSRKGCRRNATLVVASRARLPVPHHTPVPQRHRIGNGLRLIAIDHRGRGGAFILTCYYEYRVPRCQHIKTNGTQCGSPALRNGEYCYFHFRWRMTHVDLSQSAHHVTSMFDLPVLEDADSIQITLGQIMRMIVCRHQYSPLFTTKSSRSARALTSGARDLAWICSGVDVHASQTDSLVAR